MRQRISLMLVFLTLHAACVALAAAELRFRAQELKTRLDVGYAVRLIDMNGDHRLDIVIVDSDRIIWLENPNWEEHTLIQGQTKRDNVCFAPCDIDGDGKLDFAVGADWKPFNTQSGGTIQWICHGEKPNDLWKLYPIGEEPTVHRHRGRRAADAQREDLLE